MEKAKFVLSKKKVLEQFDKAKGLADFVSYSSKTNQIVTKILEEKTQFYSDQYMNPYLAASRMYVDDIIRPRETRKAIFQALEMLADKEEDRPYKKHSNIPL